jgi:hypothetical protein
MHVRAVFSFTTEQIRQDPAGTAGCGVLGLSALLSCVTESLLSSTPPFLKGFSDLAKLGNWVIGREDIGGAGDLGDEAREIGGLGISVFL